MTEQVLPGTVPAVRASAASGSPYEATIGFSRAVRVGDRIAVSGTAPVWPDGHVDPDPLVQAQRCWEIALTALGELGGTPADVVRTRTYITDRAVAGRRRPGPRRALRVDPPGEHDGDRRRTARRALGRRGRARRVRRCERNVVALDDAATRLQFGDICRQEHAERAPGTSNWHDSTTDQLPTRRPACLRAGGHPDARLGHHGSGRWRGVCRVAPPCRPRSRSDGTDPFRPGDRQCHGTAARSTQALTIATSCGRGPARR